MKIYPKLISTEEPNRYRVVIETVNPMATREFRFTVVGEDIRVLQSSSDFEDFVNREGWLVKPLLQAILHFDEAQGMLVGEHAE